MRVLIFVGGLFCYVALWGLFPWHMSAIFGICMLLLLFFMFFGEQLGLVADDPNENP